MPVRKPLAARMRPKNLEEFVGQTQILGKGRLLRRAIQADRLSSLLFYGPPGCGKTTLAQIIANTTKAQFHVINAVLAGVRDIREAINQAKVLKRSENRHFILFIDEVHRFNKAQQDALLPNVENGTLIFIGATTENPYFEVNKALVSRSNIFQLSTLGEEELRQLAHSALKDRERGYGALNVRVEESALDHIVKMANGDARAVLNALELAVETTQPSPSGEICITLKDAEESIQKKAVFYDRDGDAHYDTISAFIKSIRGSDPDAALYWLAKMIYAGEDPRFIFRRMLILASEDIGLADSNALSVVIAAARAFDYVGLPEGRFHLAHACLFLATAPKSNSTMGVFDALKAIQSHLVDAVPNHLKDANRDGEGLGHGKGYLYPHAYLDHWVAQQYLPDVLKGKVFYEPSLEGLEKVIHERVLRQRELQFADETVGLTDFDLTAETVGPVQADDVWLKRSLNNAGQHLKQVRELMFRDRIASPYKLVLDLTGDTGFLTWEACARFYRGGVWSRCASRTQYKTILNWVDNFNYMVRPRVFVMPWESWTPTFFQEEGTDVQFDLIMGFNLWEAGGDESLRQAVFRLAGKHLAAGGEMVFAQRNPGGAQRFSDLLSVCLDLGRLSGKKWQGLLKKLGETEVDFKEKLDSEVKFRHWLEALNLNILSFNSREILFGRNLQKSTVSGWFDAALEESGNSVLPVLRNCVSTEEWNGLKSLFLETLPGREVKWKQTYWLAELGK